MNEHEHTALGDASSYAPPAVLDRLQRLAVIAAVLGIIGCVIGGLTSPDSFFRAYLVGWVYWVGIAVGSLALLMLQHMTGGAWGLIARRHLEAATRTLPYLLILFVPLFFGMSRLYIWTDEELVKNDEILHLKSGYLNENFFFARVLIYFAIWCTLAFLLNRLSARQDSTVDETLISRFKRVSAPGLILYALTMTFASVDWLMSLDPHWFSTMYGVYFLGSMALSALAFLIAVSMFLGRHEPMSHVIQRRHFHDWGKLMLAFTMLWAYFCYSQFLITWAGNLPEEIEWYLHRLSHGWQYVALALVLFHFAMPFALLLSRDLKRNGQMLGRVALFMLFIRLVDLVWQAEPSFHEHAPAFYWLYLAAPLAIGGIWLFLFVRELRKRPLLPVNDPYLPEALAHAHH